MKQVECNKCGRYFDVEDNAEWGYCPFCENDNVEVPKRFEQWGYESFKDNETSEIKSDYIELLNKQNDKIKVLEKALELACEEINRVEAKFGSAYIRANGYLVDYFKTKAKEMIKSE